LRYALRPQPFLKELNMLSQKYPREVLAEALLPQASWHPYPTISERDLWEALPQDTRDSAISGGEAALDFGWPVLPATCFLEFARNGNRTNYQNVRGARRGALERLVVAECMEGKGRFLDQIANGIWATCEESYWGVPAHLYIQREGPGLPDTAEPTVDLFAGETVSLLAWTWYLLGQALDSVSPLIRPRVLHESRRRVLEPCLEREDFWWMGLAVDPRYGEVHVNNWNPWVNSNWLTTVLLLESDQKARLAAVEKILRSLDVFIDSYFDDGGCDEGPGYWGRAAASLFDNLELLGSSTDGKVDVYGEPLIQNMGKFIYRAHIADRYFVNFADASALGGPSPPLTFRYGKAIGDPAMVAFGAWFAGQPRRGRRRSGGGSLGRALPAMFNQQEFETAEASLPLPRDVWLDGIQFFAARDSGESADGLYVAAKGGHNQESHNHNDVGNFIVYTNGRPAIIDAGVETYTAKTFSPQRYEIWTMQSAYHSLPTVNGIQQAPGRNFAANNASCTADDASARFEVDIAGAYPSDAGLVSWQRTVELNRGRDVVVTDRYELEAAPGSLTLRLLTPCGVTQEEGGLLVLLESALTDGRSSGEGRVHFDAGALEASLETVAITDQSLRRVWGNAVTRILLTARDPSASGTWVLRITA